MKSAAERTDGGAAAGGAAAGPAVSVVVPVHNAAEFLPGTLEALLAQTLPSMEIVLSDDGSTDGSAALCRRFAAEHPGKVRVVEGPAAGVSVARNRALDAARGEWIGFCDADDVPYPDLYRRLLELAEREGADLALCAFQWAHPGRKDGPAVAFPYRGTVVLEGRKDVERRFFLPLLRMAWGYRGNVFCGLFRRAAVEEAGLRFVPRLAVGEDHVFLLDYLLRARRVAATDEILYDYVQHPGNSCVRFKREGEWRKRANAWRLARERLRIFKAWEGRWRHPLEGAKFRLRVVHRAFLCRQARRAARKEGL